MAFGRRKRTSLVQTAARTAVIAGTASAVSGRSADRRAAKAAAAAGPAPAAVADVGDDVIAKLERLAALHTSGALTDEEFAALKKQAMGS